MISKSIIGSGLLLASTYGSNSYGSVLYGLSGSTQVGPLTLPVTGPTLVGIGGAAMISIAAGLFVYGRQRRRKRLTGSVLH